MDDNRVNGGGWARPESDFAIDGATIPGPFAVNVTNGDQAATDYPSPYYGTEGTGEVYSAHAGGAYVAMGDGSVHSINPQIGIREFARLVARSDGFQATLPQ